MKIGRRLSRTVAAYAIAMTAVLGALTLRWLLDPFLGDALPLVTLYGAVAIAVWIGGVPPSVLAAVLGYLGATYLFVEPRNTFTQGGAGTVVGAAAYFFTCSLIIGFCEAMRRARRRAEVEYETLRVTFASMGDAVICTDADVRISSLNPVAEALTGWPRGEAVGQPLEAVFRIINEQSREPVENPARQAIRTDAVVRLANHTLLVKRDGTGCPIDDSAAPIRDAEGQVVGCVLTFRDVSRRRSLEAQLAERLSASYFLSSIIESSQDAIISKTLDGTIRTWNAAAERMFGYTSEEAVGQHISLLIPPDRLSEEDEIIARLRAGGRVDHFDTVRLRKHGEPLHVSLTISPIEDDAGHIVGASKIVRNISDRVRAEAQLHSRNERLRLLSESAGILLSTPDAATMLGRLLEKIGPYFGLDAYLHYMIDEDGAALRLASWAGVPEDALPALMRLELGEAVCGTVALTREPIHVTRLQQSDDPELQPVKSFGVRAYTCNPLLSNGRLLGTLAFASRTRDEFDADELVFLGTICQYVSAAYERLRLLDKLREADQHKDEFLATLAHELRNPLAPLANVLEIMKRSDEDRALLQQARQTMDRALTQMVALVDDLLDVSRIRRGKVILRRATVPLATVLHDAVETCRPIADDAGVSLDVALPAFPIFLDADSLRLTQVFSNLLNNACKYTPAGGRVWVRTEAEGTQVRVSVKDTGTGIAADELSGIFDMFAQVDASPERSQGGLGIGLTLARRLTELHGGTIEATSEGLGRGSEFVVRLPTVAEKPAPFAAPPVASRLEPAPARRVLVVDDNEDGAASLEMLLRINGHETLVAYDGLEAVAAAERFRPDVALLDIGLPKLNGYDTCRRIREQPWGRHMTLVAVTGWGDERDRSKSRDAGFDCHLVKPIDFAALDAVLGASPPDAAEAAEPDPAMQASMGIVTANGDD
jgi:PAS domain S-box-containing protein